MARLMLCWWFCCSQGSTAQWTCAQEGGGGGDGGSRDIPCTTMWSSVWPVASLVAPSPRGFPVTGVALVCGTGGGWTGHSHRLLLIQRELFILHSTTKQKDALCSYCNHIRDRSRSSQRIGSHSFRNCHSRRSRSFGYHSPGSSSFHSPGSSPGPDLKRNIHGVKCDTVWPQEGSANKHLRLVCKLKKKKKSWYNGRTEIRRNMSLYYYVISSQCPVF